MQLEDSVQFLKGVGPRRGEMLEKAGLCTLEDLLYHLPFRYEDRRSITTLRQARLGGEVNIVGRVSGLREHRRQGRRGGVLRALLTDESGWAELLWFHQTGYFKERLAEGSLWLVHGRVEAAPRGGLQIVHPEIEALEAGEGGQANLRALAAGLARILPVYQKPGDIPVAAMRRIVGQVVDGLATEARSVVPESVRSRASLMPVAEALRYVHGPPGDADIAALAESASRAHRTLIFEELFALQVGMTLRKAERARQPGIAMPRADERIRGYFARLPFVPTLAQKRVVHEIAADMAAGQPMNRLVHGDVGSGKTVVAFAAALQAIAAGYQVAVMAPTELLAEQHFATMRPWAEAEGLDIRMLTGSLRSTAAREVREAVAAGHTQLVVGTHALIQQATGFARLGLAIVDEQHRFGVLQRAAIHSSAAIEGDKEGPRADTLLLSATPIPRTLSLTLYGDLDVSFLDELPAGRRPITTRVIRTAARARLHERMAAAMREGRQCYIVYPLVEESEAMDLADATSMAEQLQAGAFREFRVGLVHGRMKAAEKDAVMRRFKAGDIHVLVATTVIEVGIDVANATIMVVEHAERFGLAQLHQLRGRVGRGSLDSFCCLVADVGQSAESFERLRVMERTSDGFEVAEADLKLRGPGEYLGTRQSGVPAFRAANLVRDGELLTMARKEAMAWLAQDPALARPESAELRRAIERRWSSVLGLAEVG
ncbi:MAG: ATP-dependent DNA helicase RecG [Deltaproteobacteria bacterium]|nr:ATP-dependent DNA helicase RecG [Deltaproteobacteria bacterium]